MLAIRRHPNNLVLDLIKVNAVHSYYFSPRVPATNWSSCSKDQFQTAFKQGLDLCLYNVPQTLYQPTVPRCGNGIMEDGEECDCGRAPSVVGIEILSLIDVER